MRKDLRFQLSFTVQVLVMCDSGGCWYPLFLITGQSDIFAGGQGPRLGKAGLSVIRIKLILETWHHGVSSAFTITGKEKDKKNVLPIRIGRVLVCCCRLLCNSAVVAGVVKTRTSVTTNVHMHICKWIEFSLLWIPHATETVGTILFIVDCYVSYVKLNDITPRDLNTLCVYLFIREVPCTAVRDNVSLDFLFTVVLESSWILQKCLNFCISMI